jgi:hypothetical protein
MWRLASAVALAALAVAASPARPAGGPVLSFTVFAETDLPLGQVLWTGTGFVYAPENLDTLEVADGTGGNARPFFTFENGLGGEEVRCAVPPNRYWPEGVYCHLPDNRIIRIARDGSSSTVLAQLPGAADSDGALAFDTCGRFGYALLAATGGSASNGGEVFAVRKDGRVQTIGSYPGPGGADGIAIAPRRFGPASGLLLIAVDQDGVSGRVLAIDRAGRVTAVATGLGNGLNPIVAIPRPAGTRVLGEPAPGLYLPDTNSKDVLFVSASALAPYAGQVLVGTELGGRFWLIRPNGYGGFATLPVTAQFPTGNLNLEAGAYVS